MDSLFLFAAEVIDQTETVGLLKLAVGGMTVAIAAMFSAGLWFAKSLWARQTKQQLDYEEYVKIDGRAVVKALTETSRITDRTSETLDRVASKFDSWQRHASEQQQSHEEMIRRCAEHQDRLLRLTVNSPGGSAS